MPIGKKAISYSKLPEAVKRSGLKRKYLSSVDKYIYGTKTYYVKKKK